MACGGCSNTVKTSLDRCRAIAELWNRAGLFRIEHVGGSLFRCCCVTWYGLPRPLVWVWPFVRGLVADRVTYNVDELSREDLPDRIDFNAGCGCVKVLKDAWAWARGGT